jgi:hypothetical protein
MNLIETGPEVKNSKLLFLLLGMLIIPVINAVDSLLTDIFRVTFSTLPLKSLLTVSITFHGLILLSLTYILIMIIRQTTVDGPRVLVSKKTFQTVGISFIIIIVLSRVIHLLVKPEHGDTIDLSKVYYADTTDLAYLYLIQGGLIFLRNVIVFVTFFLAIYKQIDNREPIPD